MEKITVLIADENAAFRESLRSLLLKEADILVVGEATDGHEALELAEALQPSVILIDAVMPRVGGPEVLSRLRAKSPATKVLVLSAYCKEEFVAEALMYGAKGYLLKTAAPHEITKAVRIAHAGDLWAGRRVVAKTFEVLLQKVYPEADLPHETEGDLTGREREVMRWAILGQRNKEIARHLGISEETVKTHLRNIFRKLQITRRSHLILQKYRGRRI
jgi:DNA-binding NarL/FixJ family response regulator